MQPLVDYRPRKDPLSKRQDAIMTAATLFLCDGIEAVRMTDIAERSNMGVASLYRHFKTKTGLAIAAGTHMWGVFNVQVRQILREERFVGASGASRLMLLFEQYCDTYAKHPDFVRFLDEFDHLVVQEHVEPQELEAYGTAVDSFYPIFEAVYNEGIADGSIMRAVDFPVFYRTVAHAMMGVAQKIVRGDIIPSDDFSRGSEELECIVQMARYTLGISDTDED